MVSAICTAAQGFAHAAYDHDLTAAGQAPGWVAALSASDVLNDLGLRLPLNVMGPMTTQGLVFPDPMVTGDLPGSFTEDYHQFLLREKHAWGLRAQKLTVFAREHGQGSAGTGCPVASPIVPGQATGIDSVAGVFGQYFRYHYEHSDDLLYRSHTSQRTRSPGSGGRGS